MKLSVVISVLNSVEIMRRQLLHWERMDLPDDVEFIILDDGSDPPLSFPDCKLRNFTLHATNDFRPWTVELARNQGARMAKGEYLLMTDIDYIIPKDAFESALMLKEDKMCFKRQFGVLDENGNITQDFDVLRRYGLLEDRIQRRGTRLPPHPNNFVLRKSVFWELGGYREDRVDVAYPNGGDRWFKIMWSKAYHAGKYTIAAYRPTLYMFPNGQYCGDVDYNPFSLFHTLSRKSDRNPYLVRTGERT